MDPASLVILGDLLIAVIAGATFLFCTRARLEFRHGNRRAHEVRLRQRHLARAEHAAWARMRSRSRRPEGR
jgi:hypothetical protein